MESLTLELCVAESDPLDRTLGILCKSGRELVACRSIRVAPERPVGLLLLEVERLILSWLRPEHVGPTCFTDRLDAVEEVLAEPF